MIRAIWSLAAGTLVLAGMDAILSPGGSTNYSGMLGALQATLNHLINPALALIPTRSASTTAAPTAATAPAPSPVPAIASTPQGVLA